MKPQHRRYSLPAGNTGVDCRALTSNAEVINMGSAGQTDFTQGIIVKTVITTKIGKQ